VQRATAQSKTGIFRDFGVAEAPPVFKPAGLTVCIFPRFLFILFAHLGFPWKFCTHEGTLPYRSLAQVSCRDEVGVSFVVLGILEPKKLTRKFQMNK
jgi:hypothetical protein